MDWANERYVRIYTRDTLEWLTWSWQAQALYVLMTRKCDRSGVIEVGEHGAAGLCTLLRWPASELEPALAQILRTGAVAQHAHAFVIKNYIESQEARASGAQRQREWRERRRDSVASGDTARHGVTRRNAERHGETPSLAVPSRTEPSQAKSEADVFHISKVAPVLSAPPELFEALLRFLAHFYKTAAQERVRLVLQQLERTLTPEGCGVGKGRRAKATARTLTAALEATANSTVRNPDRAIVIVLQKLLHGPVNLELNRRGETPGEERARSSAVEREIEEQEFRHALAAAEEYFTDRPEDAARIEDAVREEHQGIGSSTFAKEVLRTALGQRLIAGHRESQAERGIA